MRRPTTVAGAGGAAVVLAASLPGIGRSFWLDEAFTYSVASAPPDQFADLVPFNGGNMAMYYGMVHVWSRAVEAEWLLRLPSLLFAVAAVPVFALLARRLVGTATAWVATALLALNGSVVFAAQELRSYSLALLLVIASWLALDRAVERPDTARWVVYAVLAALSVWAHLFSLLFLAAQGASLVLAPRRSLPWRSLLTAGAVGAVVLAPVAAMAASPDAARPDWIGLLSARRATDSVQFLAGRPGSWVWGWAVLWAVGFAVSVRVVSSRWRRCDAQGLLERWRWGAVALWASVPVGLAFAVAATRPFLVGRYLVAALPAGALLAAVAVTRLPVRWRAAGVLAAVVLSVPGVVHHLDRDTADWRSAAQYVMDRARPGDAVVFEPPHDRTAFEIYAEWDEASPPPDAVVPPDPWGETRRLYTEAGDVDLSGYTRVWVVTRGPVPESAAALVVVSERTFPRTARVLLLQQG